MCGIVGAVAERDVTHILVEGLRRLEYRGYDSAGVALLADDNSIKRIRVKGKVAGLESDISETFHGHAGIAHTRWATHGEPSVKNAHPHICRNQVAVVHNGIIENFEELREKQHQNGYEFTSETDTEVIVHQIFQHHVIEKQSLLTSVKLATAELHGAYALGVISVEEPGRLITARSGSPLVIGVGIGEYFIASDVAALLPVTQRFIFLQEGDIADITKDKLTIYDKSGEEVARPVKESELSADAVERGEYRHYMLKEIFEQPRAINDTLEGRISVHRVIDESFGPNAAKIFDEIKGVDIIACGTSYHAGVVARYWMEAIAKVPCNVEVASEFRYRRPLAHKNSLFVTISQSGETADTLAALHEAKKMGYKYALAICNVPESSLVRESDLVMMTRAGPEIGVASTKAFTTQLTALLMLVMSLGRRNGLSEQREAELVEELKTLPRKVEDVLKLDGEIKAMAESFADKHHALFLGRGTHYPIAMEGALKLKEISYIHAEAYPAGELKHGPLALVDDEMPIVAVAPNDELLGKLKSNLQEVKARGGKLYVFADQHADIVTGDGIEVLSVSPIDEVIAPIIYSIPLQLFSYHVAILKGTDVDQPRNLAKSVTVE